MRRSSFTAMTTVAAVVVAAAASSMIAAIGELPATAGRPAAGSWADRGAVVTGTYSSGAAQAWRPLPATHVVRDEGGAGDATVVVDPITLRQRYTGIGFSLDETSVSNLWKLTPAERDRAIKLLVDPKTGAGLDR